MRAPGRGICKFLTGVKTDHLTVALQEAAAEKRICMPWLGLPLPPLSSDCIFVDKRRYRDTKILQCALSYKGNKFNTCHRSKENVTI